VLSRADSVAIARAVAREFERAMTRAAPAGGAARGRGRRQAPPADRTDSARQRRVARDAVVDSLAKVGHWQHMPREAVRAVVGRSPWSGPARCRRRSARRRRGDPRSRRKLREAGVGEGAVMVHPGPPAPPMPPEMRAAARSAWPGFVMLSAKLAPPPPGARAHDARAHGQPDRSARS
jgi:hypothetical protein